MREDCDSALGARASRPHLGSDTSNDKTEHRSWHSRGYLPHFDEAGVIQFVTFRLSDSLPADVLAEWAREYFTVDSALTSSNRAALLRRRIERYLDQGQGKCWLREERIANTVESALLKFDGKRYRQLAWVVMPNHVHTLFEVFDGFPMDRVVHSWKSFTAKQANKLLGRRGRFWAVDYFDRYIRDDEHLAATIAYIEENPVKAGLVNVAGDWRWGSAARRIGRLDAGETPALHDMHDLNSRERI